MHLLKKYVWMVGLIGIRCRAYPPSSLTSATLTGIDPLNMGASGYRPEHVTVHHFDFQTAIKPDSIGILFREIQNLTICDSCDGFLEAYEFRLDLKNRKPIWIQGSIYGELRCLTDLRSISVNQVQRICYRCSNDSSFRLTNYQLHKARNSITHCCFQNPDSIGRMIEYWKERLARKGSPAVNEWMGLTFRKGSQEVLYLSFSVHGFVYMNGKFYKIDKPFWKSIQNHLPAKILNYLPYGYRNLN